jgi:hypothetical protein
MSMPDDYLVRANEAFNSDHFPAYEFERAATAQALAAMGILQQLTRIADMLATARGEDATSAADREAREHWRRQRENLDNSYRGD